MFTILTFEVCNSASSSTFTRLYNHHSYLFLEFFCHPRQTVPIQLCIFFLPLVSGNFYLLSVSMNLYILNASYKWYHIIFVCLYHFISILFHLACFQYSFILQHISVLNSYLWLNNIPLYVLTTICPFICKRTFGLFPAFFLSFPFFFFWLCWVTCTRDWALSSSSESVKS